MSPNENFVVVLNLFYELSIGMQVSCVGGFMKITNDFERCHFLTSLYQIPSLESLEIKSKLNRAHFFIRSTLM